MSSPKFRNSLYISDCSSHYVSVVSSVLQEGGLAVDNSSRIIHIAVVDYFSQGKLERMHHITSSLTIVGGERSQE